MMTQPPYRYAQLIRKQVEQWLNHRETLYQPVLACQTGDLIVWKDGLISELQSMTRLGNSYVSILHREEDGKIYPRILRMTRLLRVTVIKEL